MNFGDFLSAGVDTLAGFDRDAALAVCIAPSRVREWQAVHGVYYGPTRFTRRQAQAREMAGGASLDKLVLIERKLRRVTDDGERWRLREELLRFTGRYDALSRHADTLIDTPKPPPQKQLRFSRSKSGMRTMTLTYAERDIADVEHALRQVIDHERPAAAQLADAFVGLLRNDAYDNPPSAPTRIPHAAPRPMILIPLPQWIRLGAAATTGADAPATGATGTDAAAAAEVTLHLTDGTSMTGAEFLAKHYGAELEVALFHPREGAVNLYRTQRFANAKQRDLAGLLMPVCPAPDCRHGSDACEMHHVQSWARGGMTNMNNLSPLCRYHNGVNDDDPAHHYRGRIELRGGTPMWVSPSGRAVPARTPGAMRLLFGDATSP
ncbi:HNH endonuclease signature motif containing protein [Corynebacterium sp. HMSC29G08]|uniref:HNH endonuclease signature motif containing protein n=1 Tax=Corynebacterium sp. HMSC29G08 TaxID=1581069 RepID=UPI0009F19C49|nr:HNH endonuclease signature motif containing protein [Corynebacterium sp. HMSC29G08]